MCIVGEVKLPAVGERQNEPNRSQRDDPIEWYKNQLSVTRIDSLLSQPTNMSKLTGQKKKISFFCQVFYSMEHSTFKLCSYIFKPPLNSHRKLAQLLAAPQLKK